MDLKDEKFPQSKRSKDDSSAHQEFAPHTADARQVVQLLNEVGEAKYSPWTWAMIRLYGCLIVAYLCGCLNGYDGSLMGGLNAMKTYQQYFHM